MSTRTGQLHFGVRPASFAWINTYNHRRLHSSLGYLPPIEWEHHYRGVQADHAA